MEGTPPERPERPTPQQPPAARQWEPPTGSGEGPGSPGGAPSASGGRRNPWPYALALVVVLAGAALTFVLVGGEDEAAGQTVRFQAPTDPGPDPFTKPADVRGEKKVDVGSGPFGGTGSDLVCDRELLIRALRARPDRLRAWAETLGVEPTSAAVARYIRRLRAVTLTRDTRVTNHSYGPGGVVRFQAILQAGTAVLVDRDGHPVARCRCGNPLAEPAVYVEARCLACPVDYVPPPPCDDWHDCYRRHPDPPPVKRYRPRTHTQTTTTETPPPQEGRDVPGVARFSPPVGGPRDLYTLEVGDFDPNTTMTITLTRPDGVTERYSFTTDEFGNGSYSFPRAANPVRGTYRAVVTGGGETATASATVRDDPEGPDAPAEPSQSSEPQNPAGPEVGGGTDCNNPQSQDEIDLCGG
jgi:hypothetical protein